MPYKLFVLSLFVLLAITFAFPIVTSAQETVEIPLEDLKQLRRLAVDRDYQAARADEAEKQLTGWRTQAERWRALYESEKDRADRVQEGRITELNRAIAEFKTQAEADRQRLGEMEFRIRKLKSQRKWWFAAGAGVGALGGYQLGRISF